MKAASVSLSSPVSPFPLSLTLLPMWPHFKDCLSPSPALSYARTYLAPSCPPIPLLTSRQNPQDSIC